MGMDVIGTNPKTKAGEYFRNDCRSWGALWEYCYWIAPSICGKVEHAGTNDGDGLDDADSVVLAHLLLEELASGRTAVYEADQKAAIKALPDEECSICAGIGRRDTSAGTECWKCGGTGKCQPWEADYDFAVENVAWFAAFLKNCGGFEIW